VQAGVSRARLCAAPEKILIVLRMNSTGEIAS
jgi:hypothetical protein